MIKKIYITIIILSISAVICNCSKADVHTTSDRYNIMTFNIRYGTANDGENSWPKRKDILFDVIAQHKPDILGVQEALDFQLQQLSGKFPYFRESGAGRDDGIHAGEHSAIFFDSTKFKLLQEETFWFSETPQQPGSMSWGAHFARICSWLELKDIFSGRHIFIFNNHWDHESQQSRDNSAGLLLEKISSLHIAEAPVIVMGDFNAGEDNPAIRQLLSQPEVKLSDSFRFLHPQEKEVGTFNGFKGSGDGPKIDAILVSPQFNILHAGIVRTNKDGAYPSDHFPVTATLELKK